MAKGKHATALFEVIHSAKLKQKTTETGALKTPKWWFKGKAAKSEGAASPAPAPSAPPPETSARSYTPPPPTSPPPSQSHQPSSPTIIIYDSEPDDCADPTAGAASSSSSSSGSHFGYRHSSSDHDPTLNAARRFGQLRSATRDEDPDEGASKRITFHITPRAAWIGGAGVVAVLGLAYVIGTHMSRGPSSAMGGSIEQLRAGRPAPGVLKVSANGERILGNDETPLQVSPTPGGSSQRPQAPSGGSASGGAPPIGAGSVGGPQNPAPAPLNGKRIVGMQYVIMQSYPEEADAKAAVEMLTKNGIGATAEKGYWASKPTWFTVIGTKEFDRTRNNPEYDRYISTLTTVSNRFAGQSKFKRFDPMPVRWKDSR